MVRILWGCGMLLLVWGLVVLRGLIGWLMAETGLVLWCLWKPETLSEWVATHLASETPRVVSWPLADPVSFPKMVGC